MFKGIDAEPFTLAKQLIDALHTGPSVLLCRKSAHDVLRDHIIKVVFEKRKSSLVYSTGRRNLSAFLTKHIQSYETGRTFELRLRGFSTRCGWLATWRLVVVGLDLKIVEMLPPHFHPSLKSACTRYWAGCRRNQGL
jgi:hypothetical protein